MAHYEAQVDQLLRETPKSTAARIRKIIRQTIDPAFCVSEGSVREYIASVGQSLFLKRLSFDAYDGDSIETVRTFTHIWS